MITERRERPILFKDEMIRAILEGRKTQTRRIVKGIDHDLLNMMSEDSDLLELIYGPSTDDDGNQVPDQWMVRCTECPEEGVLTMGQGYGKPGDRLWVREKFATHFIWDGLPPGHIDIQNHSDGFFYADGTITSPGCEDHQRGKWRPSIHMPRWASRITLEITDVRVERLQDISIADAKAEGSFTHGHSGAEISPRTGFRHLWARINGHESWDANPCVWVIEFKRITPEATQ